MTLPMCGARHSIAQTQRSREFGAEQFLAPRSFQKKGPPMPKFYFDIDEGSGIDQDPVGCEVARKDLRTEAMHVLSDIASDIPMAKDRALSAVVRDDTGKKFSKPNYLSRPAGSIK